MQRLAVLGIAATLILGAGLLHAGAAAERRLSLQEVPPAIVQTAREQVDGIQFTEIELVTRPTYRVYEFEGTVGKEEYDIEIRVDPEGNIVRIDTEVDDD